MKMTALQKSMLFFLIAVFGACGPNPDPSTSDESTKQRTEKAQTFDRALHSETLMLMKSPEVRAAIAQALLAKDKDADLKYRFNRYSLACQDHEGNKGFNKDYIGECGDARDLDLTGQDLSGKNLRGADFSRANLTNANLTNADLRGTVLWQTNWQSALFRGALYNEATRLPFDVNTVVAQGLKLLTYAELDSKFVNELKAWPAAQADIPTTLKDLLDLGANSESDTQLVDDVIVKRKSVAFYDLVAEYHFRFDNKTPFYSILLMTKSTSFIGAILDRVGNINLVIRVAGHANRMTFLNAAIQLNLPDIVRFLLQRGANPNFSLYGQPPALKVALGSNQNSILADLVAAGANAQWISPEGRSLIDLTQDVEAMKYLASVGADASKVDLFAHMKSAQIDWLVDHGADVNARDSKHQTLLMASLLKYETDPTLVATILKKNVDVDAVDANGQSAYAYAIYNNLSRELAAWNALAAKGIKPLGLIVKAKSSVLRYALGRFNDRSLFIALARTSGDELNRVDDSSTPFFKFIARYPSDADSIRELARLGGNINAMPCAECGFLADMFKSNVTESFIKLMIELGADLNLPGSWSETPLMSLVSGETKHDVNLVDLLLKNGADPKRIDSYKSRNVLFFLWPKYASSETEKVFDRLVAAGADPNALDKDRSSILSDVGIHNLCKFNSAANAFELDPEQVRWIKFLITRGVAYNPIQVGGYGLANKLIYGAPLRCLPALTSTFTKEFKETVHYLYSEKNVATQWIEHYYNGFTGDVYENVTKPYVVEDFKFLLTQVKALVAMGLDPKVERKLKYEYGLLHTAYKLRHLELIKYLRGLGVVDAPLEYRANYPKATPDNACMHYAGTGQAPRYGGCQFFSNSVWTMPSTFDHCVRDAQSGVFHCDQNGAAGPIAIDATHSYALSNYCKSLAQSSNQVSSYSPPDYEYAMREFLEGRFAKLPLTQNLLPLKSDLNTIQPVLDIKTGALKVFRLSELTEPLKLVSVCVGNSLEIQE